jgi:hypothetical protein
MTTDIPLKHQYELAEDALELATLAKTLEQDEEDLDAASQFGPMLAKTLSRENGDDQKVLRAALAVLRKHGDDDAADWLVNEVEVESSLQYSQRKGKTPLACLLFTMPVVFAAFQDPGAHLQTGMNFDNLHQVLEESHVISAHHGFRLLSNLYTYEQLSTLTHHEVLKTTLALSDQVVDEPRRMAAIEPFPENSRRPAPPVDTRAYPHVQLRFILGMAVTARHDLNDVFPTVETGMAEAVPFALVTPGEVAGYTAGRMENGRYWAELFARLIEASTTGVAPVLEVGPPDGFHGGLKLGLELARLQDAQCRLMHIAGSAAIPVDQLRVAESPLVQAGELKGMVLTVSTRQAPHEALETIEWACLLDESLGEALAEWHGLRDRLDIRDVPGQPDEAARLYLH